MKNAETAVKHLALGRITDGVKLLLKGDSMSEEEINKLDLYSVAAVKSTGGKISEIKFCDRLKALQLLMSYESSENKISLGFAEALKAGAENLE